MASAIALPRILSLPSSTPTAPYSKKRKLSSLSRSQDDLAPVALLPAARAVSCIRQLRRLHALIEQEMQLLHQIRYKQKNQHRSATWWRHLAGSQRVVKRVQEEFGQHVLPVLDKLAQDGQASNGQSGFAKPILDSSLVLVLVHSSLRLILLAEQSGPTNKKTAAALEQLLRAALFMPLAMTLKALVARLDSSILLMATELHVMLGLVSSSAASNPITRVRINDSLISLPEALSQPWTALRKDKTGIPGSSTSVSALATPLDSLQASRESSSSLAAPLKQSKAAVEQPNASMAAVKAGKGRKKQEQRVQLADISHSSGLSRPDQLVEVGSHGMELLQPALMPEAEEPEPTAPEGTEKATPPQDSSAPSPAKKAKVKSVKKRKKAAAEGDDIDAIFAGL